VTTAFAGRTDGATALKDETEVFAQVRVQSASVTTRSSRVSDRRAEAKLRGYEGESCHECQNFTLMRNGTCLKCDTCGSTSGCS
jgi:ribonucleoside-diphosphate reductase alpha chain